MTYAILLQPHLNVRYFESLKKLAYQETALLLEKLPSLSCLRTEIIAGLEYLCFEGTLSQEEIGYFSSISSIFALFIWKDGAFYPVALPQPSPKEILEMRSVLKYKGKTNELFTSCLVHLALLSSAYFGRENLHILDPLCGRGTSLFASLNLGLHPHGIEIDETDIAEIRHFLVRFTRFHRWKYKEKTTSLTQKGAQAGIRYEETFAPDPQKMKENPYQLDVVLGNTVKADAYYKAESMHLIVADLPYGIQHAALDGQNRAGSDRLMQKALPKWSALLKKGGAMALSFNSHVVSLEEMRLMVEKTGLTVLRGGVYDDFSHWVEQAVMRDIVIAIKE